MHNPPATSTRTTSPPCRSTRTLSQRRLPSHIHTASRLLDRLLHRTRLHLCYQRWRSRVCERVWRGGECGVNVMSAVMFQGSTEVRKRCMCRSRDTNTRDGALTEALQAVRCHQISHRNHHRHRPLYEFLSSSLPALALSDPSDPQGQHFAARISLLRCCRVFWLTQVWTKEQEFFR